jgi:hypothetical protein
MQTECWDDTRVVWLKNAQICVAVAPELGGRVVSLRHRGREREFLWRHPALRLAPCPPGSAYDPHFYGGIDEVMPCDIPEVLADIACPDHGELWTTTLTAQGSDQELSLRGTLPQYGLSYQRGLRLEEHQLICDYRIGNPTAENRPFIWKLHAALAVQPGDRMLCSADEAYVPDPAWSRRSSRLPFAWPTADGVDFSVVPAPDGSTEFLVLQGLREGMMGLAAQDGARIECRFDRKVFPCCWYFASHGALGGAYTAVLEPCTSPWLHVREAAAHGGGVCLGPEETLTTTVVWSVYA